MATLFWEKSSHSPVRTAITAAYMLHEMANTDGIEPAVKMSMLDNAKHFETKAIGVMKAAQKTNRQLATLALDCPLKMWTDMTLLDVAVKGECNQFVEECCREAIDARMYGDLDPYQNSLPWIFFNVFPLFGIWAAIGAYFPWLEGQSFGLNDVLFRPLVKFKLPPESDVLRGSTQRRVKADLRDQTLTSWAQFVLFWKAPIVVYVCNTLFMISITVTFTWEFLKTSPVLQNSDQLRTPVANYEIVLMIYRKDFSSKRLPTSLPKFRIRYDF